MARRPLGAGAGRELLGDGVVLGVHGDGKPEPRGPLHPVEEGPVVRLLEVVDARVAHECLEADHAPVGELVEPVEVAGDEAAPEADSRRAPSRGRPRP